MRSLVFSILVMPSLVFASSDHGINWWHLGSAYKDAPALGWLFLTFLIFVYALVRVIKKPLSLYLEVRSKDIEKQILEGKQAKAESEAKLRLYEERLRSLDREIEIMKESFLKQAEAEKHERERQVQDMEKRIIKEAEDTIKADYERQKNRLAEEVIEKAVYLAEKTIELEKRSLVDKALKNALIHDLSTTVLESSL